VDLNVQQPVFLGVSIYGNSIRQFGDLLDKRQRLQCFLHHMFVVVVCDGPQAGAIFGASYWINY